MCCFYAKTGQKLLKIGQFLIILRSESTAYFRKGLGKFPCKNNKLKCKQKTDF